MRMVTQMTDSQGQTNLTDLRSSTWEQGNGQKFRFQSAQYLNDKLGDVTMGRATRDPDTGRRIFRAFRSAPPGGGDIERVKALGWWGQFRSAPPGGGDAVTLCD